MTNSRSGDHPEVQAAAGRTVGGNPPLAGTASAASLPPPPPSDSDAAVRPGARDSDMPDDPPRSNATRGAGERPSDDGENYARFLDCLAAPPHGSDLFKEEPLHTTTTNVDAVLPPLTSCAADAADSDAASLQRKRERVRRQQEEILQQAQDPLTPAVAKSPSATSMGFEKTDAASLQRKNERVRRQQEKIFQQAQDTLTPAVARAPSHTPTDFEELYAASLRRKHKRSLQSERRRVSRQQEKILRQAQDPSTQQQITVRPPPQSMTPHPDEDTDPVVSALLRDPTMPMLRATPIEDQPEILVYDAVPYSEQTRSAKNRKTIIGVGVGLLIGALTTGLLVGSSNGSSDSNTIVSEGVVFSTALPSESLSPSQFPSLHPTLPPSQSSNPSQSPSQSLGPSLAPSISTSPTPLCFGGEINIHTDSNPEVISWEISRMNNADGVSNAKVVLEGFPEQEAYHTTFVKVCLERGDYEFTIFGGICGIDSPGYYSVTFDGVLIAQGGGYLGGSLGYFKNEERTPFSLPLPSLPPSESSSPSQFPSASFQPSESIIPSQTLSPSLRPSNSFSPSTYWSSLDWNRQGLGFNGDESYDIFGQAVALSADASTMAVGANWGGRTGKDRPGYVKVYHREGEGSSWEQRGETIRGEAIGDFFGDSLALSEDGTTLAIGAPSHLSFGPEPGQVKVYQWDIVALDYVQIGDALYGAAAGDRFGASLDISNSKILAVGATKSRNANGSESGGVAVYAWDDASSKYKQRGEVIDGDASGEAFGDSVSIAGNGQKLAVGAPWNDSNGMNSGQVRVFAWDENASNYVQLGDSHVGDLASDLFGYSVSLSRDGTTLAVGAPGYHRHRSGQAKVFAWDDAASSFKQIDQSLYGKAANDDFGESVALSSTGNTLAVGALQGYSDKPGYVGVYEWDAAALEYKRIGQILRGEASADGFGEALALAGNGRVLAVGASGNDRNGTSSGRVEVFDLEL